MDQKVNMLAHSCVFVISFALAFSRAGSPASIGVVCGEAAIRLRIAAAIAAAVLCDHCG